MKEAPILTDEYYMQKALELAALGCGWVNPNPMVGAVIVKDGEIIGTGYHERYGQAHAERNALAACTGSAQGATLYVTLEPCCHYGKTPPCTEAILDSGIQRVVVGAMDANPLVAGKGVALLQQHGIEVRTGVLEAQCRKQNEVFFHFIQQRQPYVVMKYAMSMDGKTATFSGHSRWITGETARHRVQQDRHRYSAIMVGVNTVLADNPQLTCRLEQSRNPLRIICDSQLRTPLHAQVVTTAQEIPTLLATCCTEQARWSAYQQLGCEILLLPEKNGSVDLSALMRELGKRQIDSILLEGGGTLCWSALSSGLVHKVQAYIAPKLLGGRQAPTPLMGQGVDRADRAFELSQPSITQLGEDILLESEVRTCSPAL